MKCRTTAAVRWYCFYCRTGQNVDIQKGLADREIGQDHRKEKGANGPIKEETLPGHSAN